MSLTKNKTTIFNIILVKIIIVSIIKTKLHLNSLYKVFFYKTENLRIQLYLASRCDLAWSLTKKNKFRLQSDSNPSVVFEILEPSVIPQNVTINAKCNKSLTQNVTTL